MRILALFGLGVIVGTTAHASAALAAVGVVLMLMAILTVCISYVCAPPARLTGRGGGPQKTKSNTKGDPPQ